MVLEQETLRDKAMKLYACKLTIKKRARFSDKQSQYLTEQFQKGEESGRKCNTQEVSKSLGLERDQGGARIFHPDEVLTA